jgi:hypothetical protein
MSLDRTFAFGHLSLDEDNMTDACVCLRFRPLFDQVTINFTGSKQPLIISAPGASTNIYVKSLTVDGQMLQDPVIRHEHFAHGGEILFEMSSKPETWTTSEVCRPFSARAICSNNPQRNKGETRGKQKPIDRSEL